MEKKFFVHFLLVEHTHENIPVCAKILNSLVMLIPIYMFMLCFIQYDLDSTIFMPICRVYDNDK